MASSGNARARTGTPVARGSAKVAVSPAVAAPAKSVAKEAAASPKGLVGSIVDNIRLCIPSLTTLIAVGLGTVAIMNGRHSFGDSVAADKAAERACWLVVAAFAIDFFDGALARLLGACSAIGASLDFLADSTAYVLAPAILLPALCGNIGWAFGALWLGLGSYRCSRQEGEEMKDDRKAGRFYGLISNHAACQLALSVIVSCQWGLHLHRRPDVIVLFVVPLCMLMVSPLWYWKLTYGPAWWSRIIYPILVAILACAYYGVGAEVLLTLNTLYLVLGPIVDDRFYLYLPTFANITCCLCGGMSILVGAVYEGAASGYGFWSLWWTRPGWWICIAFAVDSVCAIATSHKSTKALRLQCGCVAFTIAPIFLFIAAPQEPFTLAGAGAFLLCSLYRRTVAVAGQVDIAAESAQGMPNGLSAAVLSAIHFAGHTDVLVSAALGMSGLMVAPIAFYRHDQAVNKRWLFFTTHALIIACMVGGQPEAAIGGLVTLTLASVVVANA